eukprot:1154627-Pelagomonas_calceolata.AAC.5
MAGILNLTNHGVFSSILFALMFWCKDSKSLKITQFGAVGGQGWRLSGQKVGFTPQLNWQGASNLGL